MFGFFLGGLVLSFVLMLISPIVLYSRLWSAPVGILSFISSLLVLVGSALGTAMAIVAQVALSSQPDLNIQADIGVLMFAFMWIATGFSVVAFLIHSGMCCCCISRRDIRTGRRNIDRYHLSANTEKKKYTLPTFRKTRGRRAEPNSSVTE